MLTKSFDLVRETIVSNGDALFHCFIPLHRHVVKKNSRPIKRNFRTGAPFIGKSDKLVGAEFQLQAHFRRQMQLDPHFKTLTCPLWAVFLFYFPVADFVVKNGARRGQLSQRLPDLSNLYECPQDALQKAGVIANDHLICAHDLSRRLPAEKPGLEVFLFEHPLKAEPPLQLVRK